MDNVKFTLMINQELSKLPKKFGVSRDWKDPIAAKLSQLGHSLKWSGYLAESELGVFAELLVSYEGNHSFISTKTSKPYEAIIPDVEGIACVLEEVNKRFKVRINTNCFDLDSWQKTEEQSSVFAD